MRHNSPAMQVTYQLTQRDFYEAFIAHRNRSSIRKWIFRLIASIIFGVALLNLGILVVKTNSKTFADFFPLLVLACLWGLILWGAPHWAARTQFRKQPSVQGPRTATLNNEGVNWKWDGGNADVGWKNFLRWQESKTQFVIYTSPIMFNMIPKRALTSEQVSEVRSLLMNHVGAAPRSNAT